LNYNQIWRWARSSTSYLIRTLKTNTSILIPISFDSSWIFVHFSSSFFHAICSIVSAIFVSAFFHLQIWLHIAFANCSGPKTYSIKDSVRKSMPYCFVGDSSISFTDSKRNILDCFGICFVFKNCDLKNIFCMGGRLSACKTLEFSIIYIFNQTWNCDRWVKHFSDVLLYSTFIPIHFLLEFKRREMIFYYSQTFEGHRYCLDLEEYNSCFLSQKESSMKLSLARSMNLYKNNGYNFRVFEAASG